MIESFSYRVYEVVKKIPAGMILTYQQVATKAGNPKAYRAVGTILSKNFDPAVPCHRVICSDGTMGGYNRGLAEKIRKLHEEGYSAL